MVSTKTAHLAMVLRLFLQRTMPCPYLCLCRQNPLSFIQDILCGIPVSVVMMPARWAIPFANRQILNPWILVAALMAQLAGRIELVYLNDLCPCLRCLVFEDAFEFGKAVVHDLAAMSFLHPLHVEVFQTDDCILPAEFLCELEMIIAPLVSELLVQPCKGEAILSPVV